MRIIAILFVVAIHTTPFKNLGLYGNTLNFIIDSTARFAVPFFFMTSGYFFAHKISRTDSIEYLYGYIIQISTIYLYGIVITLPIVLLINIGKNLSEGIRLANILSILTELASPMGTIYYGNTVTPIYWFFPALIFSIALVYLFWVTRLTQYMLPIALGLHIIGLIGQSYTMLVDIPLRTQDALFFGFFYTSLGFYIWNRKLQEIEVQQEFLLGGITLGWILQVTEQYVLHYDYTDRTLSEGVFTAEFTIGTIFFTMFLFLYLLSKPKLGKYTLLPSFGRFAVGIYVAHPPVLYSVRIIRNLLTAKVGYNIGDTLLWHLLQTPVVILGAFAIYYVSHIIGVIEIGGSHLPKVQRLRSKILRR